MNAITRASPRFKLRLLLNTRFKLRASYRMRALVRRIKRGIWSKIDVRGRFPVSVAILSRNLVAKRRRMYVDVGIATTLRRTVMKYVNDFK